MVIKCIMDLFTNGLGLPGGSDGKESACNAGDPGLISWSERIPGGRDRLPTPVFMGFPGGSDSKESAWNARDPGTIPGLGISPKGACGNPLQYSCLERIPMDRGTRRSRVYVVTKSQTCLSD